ncbi:hypothetical protein ABMA27_005778 [Loxostege sticticalis]|uniref:Carboxylic ester hydrolase n=1 Tax=Loxostege sticticalis TaxID=481309 RepID=A0ABR3HGG5_LOXSC
MVFIHGGGFRDGSGSPFLYGPQYFIRHDVILVTFNYRLEILGFLCLGIKEAPGNAGMKDQVAALRWIKKNIKAFGGDPDNITIFGESAGSASVMYHLLSPMSTGLFHKAIMQSGSAISPWSFQFEPLKTASLLASQLGHETEDPNEIHRLFMNHSHEALLSARVPRGEGDHVLSENIFVPCAEKKFPNVEQFLPDTPYSLMSQGLYNKVPVIIGYNSAEGYLFVGKENDTTISKMNFVGGMPRDLQFPNEGEKLTTAQKLRDIYMGQEDVSRKTLKKFAHFVGDSGISFPVVFAIDLLVRTSDKPVFAYKMCYDGWMNFAKRYFGLSAWPGATHADELFYMFKIRIPVLLHEYVEWNMIQNITSMWTNFAKYSVPTTRQTTPPLPNWVATNKTNPHVLVIDKEFAKAALWESDIMRFWNSTYATYRRKK